MSYHTSFTGSLQLSRQLTLDEYRELESTWTDGAKVTIPGNSFGPNYSPWTIDDKGKELFIECDGSAYYWEEILRLMVENFFTPKDILLNGTMRWDGEEGGDIGRLTVKDNEISTISLDDLTGMKANLIRMGAQMAEFICACDASGVDNIFKVAVQFQDELKDLVDI